MKIISKYRDYYDNIYISKEPLWLRNTTTITSDETKPSVLSVDQIKFLNQAFSEIPRPRIFKSKKCVYDVRLDYILLGYCGKLIPLYLYQENTHTSSNIICFDNIEEYIQHYKCKGYILKDNIWKPKRKFDNSGLKAWIQEFNNNKVPDIFVALNSPIFLIDAGHKDVIKINPRLLDLGLQRIIAPYTAYQDISTFLSNQLVREESVPIFSDELKRDAHGFDKWSFKKKVR